MSQIISAFETVARLERSVTVAKKAYAEISKEAESNLGLGPKVAAAQSSLEKQQTALAEAQQQLPILDSSVSTWAFQEVARNNVKKEKLGEALVKYRRILADEIAAFDAQKADFQRKYVGEAGARRVAAMKEPDTLQQVRGHIAELEKLLTEYGTSARFLAQCVAEELRSIEDKQAIAVWKRHQFTTSRPICLDRSIAQFAAERDATLEELPPYSVIAQPSIFEPYDDYDPAAPLDVDVSALPVLEQYSLPLEKHLYLTLQQFAEEERLAHGEEEDVTAGVRRKQRAHHIAQPGETYKQRLQRIMFPGRWRPALRGGV
jgi:hypothetical protein